MARTGPVKSHTIISYIFAYNILCFIRFTYLIGSGISQSKDEYIYIFSLPGKKISKWEKKIMTTLILLFLFIFSWRSRSRSCTTTKKNAQVTTETYKTYMSPVTTIFYCVMNSVFLFFLSEQADKGQLPERTAQRSDNYTPAIYMVWRRTKRLWCVHARLDVIVTLTRQSDLVTMI